MKTNLLLAIVASVLLTGCNYQTTADEQQAAQTRDLQTRSQAEVGIAQPTNFTRKRLANRIMQMLDSPNLATISYLQGLDGSSVASATPSGFLCPPRRKPPIRRAYRGSVKLSTAMMWFCRSRSRTACFRPPQKTPLGFSWSTLRGLRSRHTLRRRFKPSSPTASPMRA